MNPVTVDGALTVAAGIFRAALTEDRFQPRWTLDPAALLTLTHFAEESRVLAGMLPPGSIGAPGVVLAQHVAVTLRAFALALNRQQVLDGRRHPTPLQAPGTRTTRDVEHEPPRPDDPGQPLPEQRSKDAERRLKLALDHLARADGRPLAAPFDPRSARLDAPLASPVHQALLHAFAHPAATSAPGENGTPPWLDRETPEARATFERLYVLCHAEAMTSALGSSLVRAIHAIAPRSPQLLRGALLRSLCTWGAQHVFGEVDAVSIPHLPLEALDVGPAATWKPPPNHPRTPAAETVQGLLEQLLAISPIVLVCGAPGCGKSLIARKIAAAWAASQVTARASATTSDLPVPIVIDGGVDFASHDPCLSTALRRALLRQAEGLGLAQLVDDEARKPPSDSERVIYIVDGLDEAGLSRAGVASLFNDLLQTTSDTHRAVVFLRWEAIPDAKEISSLPTVTLHPSLGGYYGSRTDTARWLELWNQRNGKAMLSMGQLIARVPGEALKTPLLLFMAALTCETQPSGEGWDDEGMPASFQGHEPSVLGALYERFFRRLTLDQCDHARTHDPATWEAVGRLLQALRERHPADLSGPEHAPTARARAMLWLLSRFAWATHAHQGHGETLSPTDAARLLQRELGLPPETSGRLLVRAAQSILLQADTPGEDGPLVFGHRTFREFFVARYWALVLRRVIAEPDRADRRSHETTLLEGRLLGATDESFSFLLGMLNGPSWSEPQRRALVPWAQASFLDETPDFLRPERPRPEDDRRPALREAALAIGSSLSGSPGIVATEPTTLKTLLTRLSITVSEPILRAPRFSCDDADLEGVDLRRCHLDGANLPRANLTSANLEHASLSGANLSGATLQYGCLNWADLSGATLAGANVSRTVLYKANLRGANLAGADFREVNAFLTDLRDTNLVGARLDQNQLLTAKMEGALRDPPKPGGQQR
ncbi:pentapeptide repeat-containing protein [Chondromyces crocatus]|uniref:AAA+ ATPase domain-containing protein n=1 Tax=Chondromyces crocatus TaxID=52 RepID=A0A0K1EHV6_CHOCO|nr:pentapeptide repeat-containing protein [Chondromyces crocatus]AKT40456.1 uncharacterized protein CMC5_046110 [Chondromyces crocatus]